MTVPAFVGVAEGRNGNPQASGNTLTISVPSGAAGELLVAVIGVKTNPSTATPSGWTPIIAGFNQCVSGTDPQTGIRAQLNTFWRVADGSETSVTVNFGAGVIHQASGAVLRYSGVDTNNPIDVSACDNGVSASPTAPSITTTVPDDRVIRAAVADTEDAKSVFTSEPATARFNHESTSVFGPGSSYTIDAVVTGGSDEPQATVGPTGTASWSLPAAEQWAAQTVAIRSADVGAAQEGCAAAIVAIIRRIWESIINGINSLFKKGSAKMKERREGTGGDETVDEDGRPEKGGG